MYQIIEIEDTVRVPPQAFNEPLEPALKKLLAERYEGKIDRDIGAIVLIMEAKTDGIGKVIPGDGAAYYNTVFKALAYKPELQEVADGEVIEIVEFGAFVRLGPLDGLVHVSQIADDFLNYDSKGSRFIGKASKKSLQEGDKVRARIVTISLRKAKENKIGLTMRQPGLGKFEWLASAGEVAAAEGDKKKRRGKRVKKEEK